VRALAPGAGHIASRRPRIGRNGSGSIGPEHLGTPRLQPVQPGRPHHNQGLGVAFCSCGAGVSPACAFKVPYYRRNSGVDLPLRSVPASSTAPPASGPQRVPFNQPVRAESHETTRGNRHRDHIIDEAGG
jgi:hypothetical protein